MLLLITNMLLGIPFGIDRNQLLTALLIYAKTES